MKKERVLFICIHNASRSQMAEGFFRSFYGENYDIHSAGSDPQTINPMTIRVMSEIGIDISEHTSNSLKDYEGQEFDFIITVCGNQNNACPFFIGGKKYFKKSFKDPSALLGTETEKIGEIREIRDEIGDWIQDLYNYHFRNSEANTQTEQDCCDLEEKNADDCGCCFPTNPKH